MGNKQLKAIIDPAIEKQEQSYDFYTGLRSRVKDPATRETLTVRQMLDRMANEELKHKEKVEYLYTTLLFPKLTGDN